MLRGVPVAALGLLAMGCASIIGGTTQTISVNSSPSGAQCQLVREGQIIGNVVTPSGVVVEKTKHNITVTCTKDGFEPGTEFVKSGIEGSTWGNIVLGGVVGWAVDSASGADNKYADSVTVVLAPDLSDPPGRSPSAPTGPAASPAPGAPPAGAREAAERLQVLQKLYDDKAITKAEYEARRRRILDGI